tara:strand:- start:65 stop:709 length:645 start_codon:yes stop_codon:yes gene_type:complete
MMTDKEIFERDGFLEVPEIIIDPKNLFTKPPKNHNGSRTSGSLKYNLRQEPQYDKNENQVPGSFSVYNNPKYREIHRLVRRVVQNILEIDLHPTYFYERFYYAGQELKRHSDRPACEISVTLQISTNLKEPWDIWFQKPDGKETSIKMKSGDAVIYKGCEREHWRFPMKSNYNILQNKINKLKKKEDDTYLHQIFFHYVDAQGPFVHYAYDAIK